MHWSLSSFINTLQTKCDSQKYIFFQIGGGGDKSCGGENSGSLDVSQNDGMMQVIFAHLFLKRFFKLFF